MKPYQHHDPILDRGKAEPHPKRPTTRSKSSGLLCFVYTRKVPVPHNTFRNRAMYKGPSPHSKDGREIKREIRAWRRAKVRKAKREAKLVDVQ